MGFLSKLFSKKAPRAPWQLPDGILVYAIGDVHGRMDLLLALMKKIEADLKQRSDYTTAYLVPLGDYIDRGFQSNEVIEYFAAFQHPILELIPLVGNHELMMADFFDNPETGPMWFSVGGMAAANSYGVAVDGDATIEGLEAAAKSLHAAIPQHHHDFLSRLRLNWQCGDYFFVHAGIRPKVAIEDQRAEDMVGIRQDFTLSDVDHGICVVYGHSGVDNALIAHNKIALDTGAFATGKLSAVALQGSAQSILQT